MGNCLRPAVDLFLRRLFGDNGSYPYLADYLQHTNGDDAEYRREIARHYAGDIDFARDGIRHVAFP